MLRTDIGAVVGEIRALVTERYPDPDAAARIGQVLDAALAADRYPGDERDLAAAVTADLQSVNGDKHLRLLFHEERLPERQPDDDAEEYAAMTRWARRTCGGIGQVRRLPGNIGHLDLRPVVFPAVIAGDSVTAALSLVADTGALLLDLRGCLGGDPTAVAFLISYLWDHEPVQVTGLRRRAEREVRQLWTHAHVPGRRFGRTKPVYVLTAAATFSGGEQLAYDLRQLGRATLVGERTRGGAHAREGFRLRPHLEATVPVAVSINPVSGGNWEGVGIPPDVDAPAAEAFDAAYRLALDHVIEHDGPSAAEARAARKELRS